MMCEASFWRDWLTATNRVLTLPRFDGRGVKRRFALAFTSRLREAEIRVSMDGRDRALDNVFIERLWRTVKYEHVYLYDCAKVIELEKGLDQYFTFYNYERPHQSLSYQTPAEVHLKPIPA